MKTKLQLAKISWFKTSLFTMVFLASTLLNAQTQIGQDIDGEGVGDQSGNAVSMSSDGSMVVIGASGNSDGGALAGHARVYQNDNGTWVQVGQDINGEAEGDQFGRFVSISDNGSVIAIGSQLNDGNGSFSGHVRVYENINGVWTQIGQDIDGEFGGDQLNSSSLSSDGSMVAIGAFLNDGNGTGSGHVRVFENQNGSWVQIGQDIDGEAENDQSGRSVSLSSDGSIVAVGAAGNDGNGNAAGHVRVYENQNGSWVQIGQDIDGEGIADLSGTSISLSSDGSIVAIGALANDDNGEDSGHVRVYENQNGTWIQVGQDIDGEATDDESGFSTSLSSDGTIVAIGASRNDGNGSNSGHARVYRNQNGTWVQVGQDIDGEVAGDISGNSVSLSSDGSTIAIGAPFNDQNGNSSGHVRVFDLSTLLSVDEANSINFSLYPNPAQTNFQVSLPDTGVLKSITLYNTLGQKVLSTKESSVDSSSLVSGIYLVQVRTSNGIASRKLIIE